MIEKLSNAYAPSGREEEVRKIIIDELSDFYKEIKVDNIGNLVVHKPGKKKIIAITAPMDEVGFLVTHDENEKIVNTASIGTVNQKALHNIVVKDENDNYYISSKDNKISEDIARIRHFEFDKISGCKVDTLYNGLTSKTLIFDTKYRIVDSACVGKALERALTCSVLLNLARGLSDSLYEYYFIFTAYNNCDKKGAVTATFDHKIDDLFNICCIDADRYDLKLNEGPAVILRDKLLVSSNDLAERIRSDKTLVTTDLVCEGGVFQKQPDTKNVVSLAIPVKNMYSPNEVASMADIDRTYELLYQAVLP